MPSPPARTSLRWSPGASWQSRAGLSITSSAARRGSRQGCSSRGLAGDSRRWQSGGSPTASRRVRRPASVKRPARGAAVATRDVRDRSLRMCRRAFLRRAARRAGQTKNGSGRHMSAGPVCVPQDRADAGDTPPACPPVRSYSTGGAAATSASMASPSGSLMGCTKKVFLCLAESSAARLSAASRSA